MKIITKSLAAFSIGLVVLTITFRFLLSTMLQNRLFASVWVVAIIYGVLIFIMGWIFGKKDKINLPLYDIGFRFHLTTFIIFNLIAEVWFLIGMQSEYENVRTVHLTVIYWGFFLLIHLIIYLITQKNTVKGIEKSDIFD